MKDRIYCWTHGDCNNPIEGHKKEDTFQNMMGGSNKDCSWLHASTSTWRCGIILTSILLIQISSKTVIPPSPPPSKSAVADSGTTDHFLTKSDGPACSNHLLAPLVPRVAAANCKVMKATHSVTVPLSSHLSPTASSGHVLECVTTSSLISIGKLCDDDYAALFTKYNVHIIKNGSIIIKGQRNYNGLWNIPLAP